MLFYHIYFINIGYLYDYLYEWFYFSLIHVNSKYVVKF